MSNLDFDGMGAGTTKPSNNGRYAGNPQSNIKNADSIQMTQMPVKKGYHGAKTAGPATANGAAGYTETMPKAKFSNPNAIQVKQMPNRKGNAAC